MKEKTCSNSERRSNKTDAASRRRQSPKETKDSSISKDASQKPARASSKQSPPQKQRGTLLQPGQNNGRLSRNRQKRWKPPSNHYPARSKASSHTRKSLKTS